MHVIGLHDHEKKVCSSSESQSSSSSNNSLYNINHNQKKNKEVNHSITGVEVDHYSFDENHKFMIVRTVEEMQVVEKRCRKTMMHHIIQTIAIY